MLRNPSIYTRSEVGVLMLVFSRSSRGEHGGWPGYGLVERLGLKCDSIRARKYY